MARRIADTSKKARRVRVTSRTARKITREVVAKGLGTSKVTSVPNAQRTTLALQGLQLELRSALRSQGGRPGLEGADRRQKIPMANADWKSLEALARRLRADGLATTPGQIAAKLLHGAIAAVDLGEVAPRAQPYAEPADSEASASRLRERGPDYEAPRSSNQALETAPELHGRIPSEDELRAQLQDALTVVVDALVAIVTARSGRSGRA